jgi:arylsulfatase A-like enzyme
MGHVSSISMTAHASLVAGATAAALCAPLRAAAQAPSHPPPHNVLLVVLDDVGVDLLGSYENYYRSLGRAPGTPASTPTIDALSGESLNFANAWTCPTCTPSRAQIMTGRHGSRTGMGAVLRRTPLGGIPNPGLSHKELLLPEVLGRGPTPYVTAAVGKWHLVDHLQLAASAAHALGAPAGTWFDYFAGSPFNLERALSAPPGTNSYYAWRKIYATAIGPGSSPCGPGALPCEVDRLTPPLQHYATADTTDDALTLIQTLPEPWFLYVAYNSPHFPYHVTPTQLSSADCLPPPTAPTPCVANPPQSSAELARCMLSVVDEQFARLLCAIDPGATTVILTADNGTDGNAIAPPFDPARGKGSLYQGGVGVPLIVRSPLTPPALRGTFHPALVASTDLFATVAQLGGAAVSTPESVSLVPYLAGTAHSAPRTRVYTEGFFPNFTPRARSSGPPQNYYGSFHNQAVSDGRFKLLRLWDRVGATGAVTLHEEFYDLAQGGPLNPNTSPPTPTPDWFELNNLLAGGTAGLAPGALLAYTQLGAWLDASYPSLVR